MRTFSTLIIAALIAACLPLQVSAQGGVAVEGAPQKKALKALVEKKLQHLHEKMGDKGDRRIVIRSGEGADEIIDIEKLIGESGGKHAPKIIDLGDGKKAMIIIGGLEDVRTEIGEDCEDCEDCEIDIDCEGDEGCTLDLKGLDLGALLGGHGKTIDLGNGQARIAITGKIGEGMGDCDGGSCRVMIQGIDSPEGSMIWNVPQGDDGRPAPHRFPIAIDGDMPMIHQFLGELGHDGAMPEIMKFLGDEHHAGMMPKLHELLENLDVDVDFEDGNLEIEVEGLDEILSDPKLQSLIMQHGPQLMGLIGEHGPKLQQMFGGKPGAAPQLFAVNVDKGDAACECECSCKCCKTGKCARPAMPPAMPFGRMTPQMRAQMNEHQIVIEEPKAPARRSMIAVPVPPHAPAGPSAPARRIEIRRHMESAPGADDMDEIEARIDRLSREMRNLQKELRSLRRKI